MEVDEGAQRSDDDMEFGPTTTTTADGDKEHLADEPIMREASNGHAATNEAMQMAVKRVSMMSGSNG